MQSLRLVRFHWTKEQGHLCSNLPDQKKESLCACRLWRLRAERSSLKQKRPGFFPSFFITFSNSPFSWKGSLDNMLRYVHVTKYLLGRMWARNWIIFRLSIQNLVNPKCRQNLSAGGTRQTFSPALRKTTEEGASVPTEHWKRVWSSCCLVTLYMAAHKRI